MHQPKSALNRRSTHSEIFLTGIKAIDVLMPLERGGKAGLFGGAGVGNTALLTQMLRNMIGKHEGVSTSGAGVAGNHESGQGVGRRF